MVRLERFDERFDTLMQEVEGEFGVSAVRDHEILNWRYFDKPTKSMELLAFEDSGGLNGFVIVEFTSERGYVFDFISRHDTRWIGTMIAGLVETALARGVQLVTFQTTAHNIYARSLCRYGFRLGSRHPLIVKIPENSHYSAAVRDFNSWILTLGDLDLETMRRS